MFPDPDALLREFRDSKGKPEVVAELDQVSAQLRANTATLLAIYSEADVKYAAGNNREATSLLINGVMWLHSLDQHQKQQLLAHLGMLLYAELRHKHGGLDALIKLLDSSTPDSFLDPDALTLLAPQPEWPNPNAI